MSRTVLVIGSVLLLLFGAVYAQEPQKRCPARIIDECPKSGCGSWDPEFDRKRNLTPDIKEQTPKPMTLDEIRALPYPQSWSLGKDRAELEKLGEGTLVRVTAYLVGVNYGDLSSANCRLVERWAVNDILILVEENLAKKTVDLKGPKRIKVPKRIHNEKLAKETFDRREALSVTAEITARVRLQRTKEENKTIVTNWFKETLDAYIRRSPKRARIVRITGLLLLDTERVPIPQQRSTDWQIHPVLEIEVCLKGDTCVADADWKKLNDVRIVTPKPLPAKPSTPFE